MILKANNFTKQICLRIRRNEFADCCKEVELHILPLLCEEPPKRVYCYTPCGGLETIEIKREQPLTLVYDMFNYDDEGKLCFLLDGEFSKLDCGRYVAKVIACGCEIYEFQIDKRESIKVSGIVADNRNSCCEGKYGC